MIRAAGGTQREGIPAAHIQPHNGNSTMTAAKSIPGVGLSTILIHDFGNGVDGNQHHAILTLHSIRQQVANFCTAQINSLYAQWTEHGKVTPTQYLCSPANSEVDRGTVASSRLDGKQSIALQMSNNRLQFTIPSCLVLLQLRASLPQDARKGPS